MILQKGRPIAHSRIDITALCSYAIDQSHSKVGSYGWVLYKHVFKGMLFSILDISEVHRLDENCIPILHHCSRPGTFLNQEIGALPEISPFIRHWHFSFLATVTGHELTNLANATTEWDRRLLGISHHIPWDV